MLNDWHVPAGCTPATTATEAATGVRRARWRAEELAVLADELARRGAAALATLPLDRRLAAWGGAVEELLDPDSDARRALFPALVASARLSPEGLAEALGFVLGVVRRETLPGWLERLPPAAPRGLGGVVLAANVPALAAQSLLPALLLGRPLLLRSSTREPLFAPALLAALARREPTLADAFAAATWPADHDPLTVAAFGKAERLLAYGGETALGALAARPELAGRLRAFGPRASVALVAGAFDPLTAARALARDVAQLDQRGCLSVQAVYTTGDARALAEALAFALAGEHLRLPPGPAEAGAAAALQQLRGEAALRSALVGELTAAQGTVLLERASAFRPVPGLRTVRVHPVPALGDALAALAPWRGRLQGAALAGDEACARAEEIREALALARVAPAGALQRAAAGQVSEGDDPLTALA
jgi:hypothetical protein